MNLHTLHSQGQKMLVKTVFGILSLLLLGGIVSNNAIAQENRAPVFTKPNLVAFLVLENTASGENIGTPVSATDPDGDELTYSLGGTDAASFRIDTKTGQLRTHTPLDYETKNTYSVTITVSDGNGGEATVERKIWLIDIPGNTVPVFANTHTTRTVPENTASGEHIGAPVAATDPDEDKLRYSLGGTDAASFRIGKKTGQLRTHKPLDYETKNAYSVTITVSDGNGGEATINVTITVTDVDDQENRAPVFTAGNTLTVSVPEDTASGKHIGAPVAATDPDEDPLRYSLGGKDAEEFHIDTKTGQLRTHKPLDYETKNTYSVTITVSDGNGGEATIDVTIRVTDDQENRAPVFTAGNTLTVSVPEDTASGKHIGAPVAATDPDEDKLRYSLGGTDAGAFRVGKKNGQLRAHTPLDYETKNTYSVKITVSDGNGGEAIIDVTINVTDIQENTAPVFTDGDETSRSVPENTASGEHIGAPVAAKAPDEDKLRYSLGGTDAGAFRIGKKTGQLRTRMPLDYETKNTYSVKITVSDGNGGTDTIDVTINVTDVDENRAPGFTNRNSVIILVLENTASGEPIGAPVSATDPDGDELTYSLGGTDADAFRIDTKTGQLLTHKPLDYETKANYSVTIIVSDGNGGEATTGRRIWLINMPGAPGAHARQAPPAETALLANYPNPFNPETWIPYQLSKPAEVTVTLYNMQGVIVRELALGHKPAGVYWSRSRAVHWDGRNASGEKVATGVYFYTFTAGDYTATRKMLIRK